LTFLAQLFPLNEKSGMNTNHSLLTHPFLFLFLQLGLNQIGHFNTENVTKLTKTKQAITPVEESEKEKKMEVDEDGEIHDLYEIFLVYLFSLDIYYSRHQKSSAEFYTNFWVLQDFFSKPFQLWERTSWNTFVHVRIKILTYYL